MHKVLDAIGDLYLIGAPLLGRYVAHKSGHGLNNRLIRALLERSEAWEWRVFDDAARPRGALALDWRLA